MCLTFVDAVISAIKKTKSAKLEESFKDELYETCSNEHSSCNSGCPVYCKNGGVPYNATQDNCKCFKSGQAMYDFLCGK